MFLLKASIVVSVPSPCKRLSRSQTTMNWSDFQSAIVRLACYSATLPGYFFPLGASLDLTSSCHSSLYMPRFDNCAGSLQSHH